MARPYVADPTQDNGLAAPKSKHTSHELAEDNARVPSSKRSKRKEREHARHLRERESGR